MRAIALRFGISTATIYRHSNMKNWPQRGGLESMWRSRPSPPAGPPRRKPLPLRKVRTRMLEVLTNQLEQLAAINEKHPDDAVMTERSARAMATIANTVDKLVDLEINAGGRKDVIPEPDEKAIHILRAELADRFGFTVPD